MNTPIPNSEIRALLELVDQFPIRQRVQYHDADDLRFVSSVLLALRQAEPEIRRLALIFCVPEPVCIYCGKTGPDVQVLAVTGETNHMHEHCRARALPITTPNPSPETAPTPSSAAPPAPTQASSSHILKDSLNTADTDAACDRESDNPGKPSSYYATAAVLPAKPPTRPKAAPRATAPAQPRTRPAVPPPAPPATPPAGTA